MMLMFLFEFARYPYINHVTIRAARGKLIN